MNGEDLEGAGNVCFRQPAPLAPKKFEAGNVVNGCILYRKVWAGDKAIDVARNSGTMRG